MKRTFSLVLLLVASATVLADEATLAPVSERFANPAVSDEPSFQKHIVPLLGRLGCNGRACHGPEASPGEGRKIGRSPRGRERARCGPLPRRRRLTLRRRSPEAPPTPNP